MLLRIEAGDTQTPILNTPYSTVPLRVADEQDDTAQHKKCFVRFVKAYVCGVWCSNLFSFSREAADTSGQGWHTLGRGSQSKVVWRERSEYCLQRAQGSLQAALKDPLSNIRQTSVESAA